MKTKVATLNRVESVLKDSKCIINVKFTIEYSVVVSHNCNNNILKENALERSTSYKAVLGFEIKRPEKGRKSTRPFIKSFITQSFPKHEQAFTNVYSKFLEDRRVQECLGIEDAPFGNKEIKQFIKGLSVQAIDIPLKLPKI